MYKKFFCALAMLYVSMTAQAQYGSVPVNYRNGPFGYFEDALVYSRLTLNGGTARLQGIGGAGTAVGGDMGASYANPAGLAMYRSSEIAFTPNLAFAGTKTDFLGSQTPANKVDFGFSNIGVVFCGANKETEEGDFRGGSLAISFVRTNQFNNRYAYSGVNQRNSLASYFVNRVNSMGISQSSLDDQYDNGIVDTDGLSYAAYLYDTVGNTNTYRSFISDNMVRQEETVTIKGASYQWSLAYGGSYKDILYIGAALGIPTFSYRTERNFKETVGVLKNGEFESKPDTLDNLTYTSVNTTTGTGVNFKIGLIVKPIEALRIGATIVTPTYYFAMEDAYRSDITANFQANVLPLASGGYVNQASASTVDGKYTYVFVAPMRANFGLTAVAGKLGFVSADVEYVPYNTASFTGNAASGIASAAELNEDNKVITSLYKEGVLNYRVGGELRLDIFRLRAGYAYFGDPYVETTYEREMQQFSGGFGLRMKGFYIDMAFTSLNYFSYSRPYVLKNGQEPIAKTNNTISNVLLTVGFQF